MIQESNADAGTVPACTLSELQFGDRVGDWSTVAHSGLQERQRTAHGILLRFQRSDEVERELQRLVELEEHCCSFVSFALSIGAGDVTLTVSGPDEAAPLLDELLRLPLASPSDSGSGGGHS
jgi:hypothetical protein